MSSIHLTRDYFYSRLKLWKALTDPNLMMLWGMRPDGFAPIIGTKFKLIGAPNPMWRGFIESEVLEVVDQSTIAYSWIGNARDKPARLSYTLTDIPNGTRVTVAHTGFHGIGGFMFCKFIMKPGLKKTLDHHLPRVLADLNEDGSLRADSVLTPQI